MTEKAVQMIRKHQLEVGIVMILEICTLRQLVLKSVETVSESVRKIVTMVNWMKRAVRIYVEVDREDGNARILKIKCFLHIVGSYVEMGFKSSLMNVTMGTFLMGRGVKLIVQDRCLGINA